MQTVAAPAVHKVIRSPLLGRQYVRVGPLFLAIGMFLYQQGGALGFGLREHATLLGKLLGSGPRLTAKYVESLRKHEASRLAEVEGQERNFLQLYAARELLAMDIDIAAYPPSKRLEQKAPKEFSNTVIALSFDGGAGLGFHFPQIFCEYWDNTHRDSPDSRLQEMRAFGIALPDTQQGPWQLAHAVADMAATAREWAASEAPDLLTDFEKSVLKRLGTNDM